MTDKTTTPPKLPAFDPREAMRLLWEKAGNDMQPQELQWFAEGASEHIASHARRMETVLNGIACMVSSDGMSNMRSGSFQHHDDVPDLLFAIADQMNVLSGLSEIAGEAAYKVGEAAKRGR